MCVCVERGEEERRRGGEKVKLGGCPRLLFVHAFSLIDFKRQPLIDRSGLPCFLSPRLTG